MLNEDELQELYSRAEVSPRKRVHYLFHKSHQDKVQRLLIALVKESYVEPHYHELAHQWEMFTVIKGEISINIFDDTGSIKKTFIVNANDPLPLVEFAPGEIHSVECLSEQALLLEVKEGPFEQKFAKAHPAFSK
ncbi:WbuC family cupin fold metalloprotein [Crocosphaera sp.]|uniref:WbuC family cupin fold metalloprotein n=1 Tax=Crocosphaera sp. TaxID=2729996 RepID=UPI002610E366|nr:WbuC family cupin fold metalloprotein [Crocosphaera sp.]